MNKKTSIIGLMLSGMIMAGCATSPWAVEKKNSAPTLTENSNATSAAARKATGQIPSAAPNSQSNTQVNSAQTMQQTMEELRQLGALDPVAQNKLMEDLQQTDPALWPLVMQQFRAAVAYKRRAAERDATAAGGNALSANGNQPADRISRLPSIDNAPIASKTPKDDAPRASEWPAKSQPVQNATYEQPINDSANAKPMSNAVVTASYNEPVTASKNEPQAKESGNWQKDLSAAIKSMESSAPAEPKTSEEMAQQARLRMLYVLAGRRDDALKPIPKAPEAMQEFWSKELYGLAMLLDSEKTPDTTRRAAESKQVLHEALTRLGETAPLVVRNLTFCTAIQSYGCYSPFKKYEFLPDQEALLYAEMDNFASESTDKGFHTQLKSSYQILDTTGQRVAEHTFTTTEEYCQNPRRDFFIGYHLRTPKRINPGKYTLQLTIEDQKSQKVGQSSIEFTIKDADK